MIETDPHHLLGAGFFIFTSHTNNMTIAEKLVSYRINKESVLFRCADAQEKSDLVKKLSGLGFEKEMMIDCMNNMKTALFVALVGGLTIAIYSVPPPQETIIDWCDFEFEYS